MQVILGAGGVISNEMVPILTTRGHAVRLVSRLPKPVNGAGAPFAASLLDGPAVARAIEGAEVAYLMAGFPYKIKVWQAQWPQVMANVIEGCAAAGVRLVFFDNVYMYGQVEGPMTEQTPSRPVSEKGKVRATIARMLMDAVEKGRLEAAIARCADFYGPNATNTFLDGLVFKNLAKGKAANWLADGAQPHSFTHTPDAAKGTADIGLTGDAFNQIWHLPTAADPLTGDQFTALAAEALGSAKTKPSVYKPWMLRLVGLFDYQVKETFEMLYQYEHPYYFDSSKFERRFGWLPASYAEGIRQTAAWAKTVVAP